VVANQSHDFQPQISFLNRSLVGPFQMQHLGHQDFSRHHQILTRSSSFSSNQCTSKFISFRSHPSGFYISDCYRTHYETQTQQKHKISVQNPWRKLPRHRFLKNPPLPFTHQKSSIHHHLLPLRLQIPCLNPTNDVNTLHTLLNLFLVGFFDP
jgi:hypothetical protein